MNMGSSAKTSLEPVEDDRTGLTVPALRRACADNLFYVQGKFPATSPTSRSISVSAVSLGSDATKTISLGYAELFF